MRDFNKQEDFKYLEFRLREENSKARKIFLDGLNDAAHPKAFDSKAPASNTEERLIYDEAINFYNKSSYRSGDLIARYIEVKPFDIRRYEDEERRVKYVEQLEKEQKERRKQYLKDRDEGKFEDLTTMGRDLVDNTKSAAEEVLEYIMTDVIDDDKKRRIGITVLSIIGVGLLILSLSVKFSHNNTGGSIISLLLFYLSIFILWFDFLLIVGKGVWAIISGIGSFIICLVLMKFSLMGFIFGIIVGGIFISIGIVCIKDGI